MDSTLRFEWDEANTNHVARHGISPNEVEQVLANNSREIDYDVADGEERWTSMGHTNNFRVLVVVWTIRDMRPVTAYAASRRNAERYLSKRGL